jgi:hypothetical protein
LQKRVIDLSSSQKTTQFEKKNHPKRSPGSQDIEVLKSANFQDFSADDGDKFFISVESGGDKLYKQGLLEEFYPSIRINIWCFPTSRVLI